MSRVAIEVLGGHGIITVCGELTTKAYVNIREIAQRVYRECGHEGEDIGVQVNVVEQSPQIAAGVDIEGAGDQGIMTGYATAETPEMLPREVVFSRRLTVAMGAIDGKSQVTVNKEGKVETVITSICAEGEKKDEITARLQAVVDAFDKSDNFKWLQNPNGVWTVGGFTADTGLTGRKLAVDNYGPAVPLGGGCFSGKDATKVDRSAAYMARKIACDFVRQGFKEVFVELAYAIGVAEPVAATAWADGKEIKIEGYDLRPRAIIETLGLRRPIFRETAMYGHYGHGFNWD